MGDFDSLYARFDSDSLVRGKQFEHVVKSTPRRKTHQPTGLLQPNTELHNPNRLQNDQSRGSISPKMTAMSPGIYSAVGRTQYAARNGCLPRQTDAL